MVAGSARASLPSSARSCSQARRSMARPSRVHQAWFVLRLPVCDPLPDH
jgi:hypothetical protein